MSDEDLFAVFGEDPDSSEDESSTNDVVRTIAQSMVAQVNENASKPHVNQHRVDAISSNSTTTESITIEYQSKLVLPWPEPTYLDSSAVLVSSLKEYGGGRGYIARNFTPAGTLIMIEESLVSWPTDNMDIGLDMLLFLMQQRDVHHVLAAIEHLYPTKDLVNSLSVNGKVQDSRLFEESPALNTQVKEMMEEYDLYLNTNEKEDVLDQLIQFCTQSNIRNPHDTSELSRTDILRILVALRYNSLETGIYLHVAMLNHDDVPNCVKFKAEKASEVRATRDIQAGEPLTISYLPRLLSHATRRIQLWQHHRFDIGATVSENKGILREMELIGKNFPQSSRQRSKQEDDSVQRRIESATSELEEEIQEILSKQRLQLGAGHSAALPGEEIERCKALEVASEALCRMAAEQLHNSKHVLLVGCRQLHLDACDLVLRQQDFLGLSFKQHNALLGRWIVSSLHLWHLQETLFGADCYLLASTFFELQEAIEQSLSRDAGFLQNPSFLDSIPNETQAWVNHRRGHNATFKTAANWASLEHYAKTQHLRIKTLYPEKSSKK